MSGKRDPWPDCCRNTSAPRPYVAIARVYAMLGRHDDAVRSCKRAIQLKPDFAQAIAACKAATRLDPESGRAHYQLGIACRQATRYV